MPASLTFNLPRTTEAVAQAAGYIWLAWISAVEHTSLSAGEQQAYLRGLTSRDSVLHPYQGDPLQALIQNVNPDAPRLEYGFPAYHLPSVIRWAQARGAHRSKRGRWYLVVPFEHGTPGTRSNPMPSSVYRVARRLQPGQRVTAGPTAGRAVHAGGMQPYAPRYVRNIRLGYEHVSPHEAMIRRPGRGRGSTYLTFRTMTSDSSGWWIPPRQGAHILEEVRREVMPEVNRMLTAGLEQDVAALVAQQLRGTRP